MKKIFCILILFCFFGLTLKAGGPWPQKKGKGYIKLSEWWITFDEHYTDVGLIDPNITTGIFNTFLYAEYGFTDRITGVLNANVFSRNYMNNLVSKTTKDVLVKGEAVNAVGDIDLGFKYGLTKPGSMISVAASLTLGIPTGKDVAGALNNLQTGDGEFNQLIQVDAGGGFSLGTKTNAYVSASLGFNNRTNGFSEEIRYGLEAGLGLFEQKLWLIGRLTGIESLKNGDTAETVTSTSIFANNTEFSSVSIEVNYYLTQKVGVSASIAGAFRGEIIAAAPSYSVGVFYDFSK